MYSLFKLLTVLILTNVIQCDLNSSKCDLMPTQYGFVCKCTEDYCDYLPNPNIKDENTWILVSSSKNGLRFSQLEGKFDDTSDIVTIEDYEASHQKALNADFKIDAIVIDLQQRLWDIYANGKQRYFSSSQTQVAKVTSTITINRSTTYQKIVGFGGALTGSVAYLVKNLKPKVREHLFKTYFHQDGINYNLLRTSIGGCDFDLEPWAYNEHPVNDKILSNFTQLDARDLLKIEQIQQIQTIMEGNDLKIMAAAWSPPPWMKSNNDWTGLSNLKTEFYETWAQYHLKYIELMQAKNITTWAISTGNEPLNGVIGWFFVKFMSLGWTPRNQAIFLNDYLGPLIKKSQFKDILIFGNDDQRYTYPLWFERMNATRSSALNYLDGLAVHWYWDKFVGPQAIDSAMQLMPNRLLLNTESCVGDKPWQTHGPELGSWERGEQYIISYIQDMQHNFNGYIDWNLVLNEEGGPNYVNNFVDASIVVNTKNYSEFYKQPIFYAIGHFSKFLGSNSKRIFADVLSPQKTLDAVGFMRPDGTIAVIIFNSASIAQDITLSDSVRGIMNLNIPPHSIHTLLYK